MGHKLTEIDDLTRSDHCWLDRDDRCFFFGEYTSRKGYAYSDTNRLIHNFKKPVSKKGTPEWPHKERAIATVGEMFGAIRLPSNGEGFVLVPAPPSKAANDPEYDDRLYQALLRPGRFDVRKLVMQTVSRKPSHCCESGERPRIEDLVQCMSIDESLANPPPHCILICDDVITNGTTFKAMQRVLGSRFPGVPIVGIFVARRAFGSDDLLLDF